MNQKGFAILPIIIVIVILLIGGGVYTVIKNRTKLMNTSQFLINKNRADNHVLISNNKEEKKNFSSFSPPSPTTCIDQQEGAPVITSLSSNSGPIGTNLEIKGCNLSGLEGDLDVYFEREDGQKFMLTDGFGSYPKTAGSLIKVVVKEPCQQGEIVYGRYSGIPAPCKYIAMTSGLYKIYTEPWGKRSNEVYFTIK